MADEPNDGIQRPRATRRWSDEERARILTEAFSPGACVAAVARRNDISTSLIYQWRDKLRGNPKPPVFVEAVVGGLGRSARSRRASGQALSRARTSETGRRGKPRPGSGCGF